MVERALAFLTKREERTGLVSLAMRRAEIHLDFSLRSAIRSGPLWLHKPLRIGTSTGVPDSDDEATDPSQRQAEERVAELSQTRCAGVTAPHLQHLISGNPFAYSARESRAPNPGSDGESRE